MGEVEQGQACTRQRVKGADGISRKPFHPDADICHAATPGYPIAEQKLLSLQAPANGI